MDEEKNYVILDSISTNGGINGEMMKDVSKPLTPEGSVYEKIIGRVITLIKVRGHDLSQVKKEVNHALLTMIMGVVTHFKRKRFLYHQLRKQQLGTLTRAGPKEFKDIFSQGRYSLAKGVTEKLGSVSRLELNFPEIGYSFAASMIRIPISMKNIYQHQRSLGCFKVNSE
uniref:Uncharacterized protein n=1 Tax=Salix viminalis TaxID=40686 RepID=A0A6N2NGY4_SALVM